MANYYAVLKAKDTNNKDISKRYGILNPALTPKYGEAVGTEAKYKVDQTLKKLNALTTNTFTNSEVETTIDTTDAPEPTP